MATIRKRPDRGDRWELRFRDPDGRQRRQLFARKTDAEQARARIRVDVSRGAYIAPDAGRVTLAAYGETWLSSRVHRPSTAALVESGLRVHVLPALGSRPIGTIRHSHVQGFVKACSERLAPGSVENVFRVLSAICSAAVLDRVIATNPCNDVVLPRKVKAEVVPPTVAEVRILLGAMPDRYRVAGMLAAGAGLRQGEALGLTVDRIDFLRRQLRVDRQMVSLPGCEPHLAQVKSDASVRWVPLADVVLDALAGHLAAFPVGPDGLVLTYQNGHPIRRNRFGAMWRQSTARAGLDFRYHDLRHHFASALIAGGCSVKAVQKALGHASAKVTLDTYGHCWPDTEDLTRNAIAAALGAPAGENKCGPGVAQGGMGQA